MAAVDTLREALTALHSGDEVTLAPLLDDAVLVQTPDDTFHGKAAVVAAFQHQELRFADVAVAVKAADDVGVRAWVEYTVTGTHVGDVEVEGRTLPASGKTVTLAAAAVADVVEGRVVSLRIYYDGLDLLDGLGLLPGAAA